jgi:hypothetical protein
MHEHLPMMEEAEFIEWEREPFRVWRGPRFDDVAAVILAIDADDDFPAHLTEGCHFHEQNSVSR